MIALMAFCVTDAQAQIKTPSASPSSKITQSIGLTDVTGLVPYGKVWRLGANAATKITFGDDVALNGTAIPKGTYAFLAVPSANSWSLEIYPYEKGSWSSYVDKTPMATVTAKVSALPFPLETFLISMDNLRSNSADLEFMWDKTIATVELTTEVDTKVMA